MRFKPRLRFLSLTPQTRRWLVIGIFYALIASILAWHIRELPLGISQPEREVISSVTTARITDPGFVVDLPYKLLLKTTLHFSDGNLLAARLLSLSLSAAGLFYFYRLSKQWWTRFSAIAITALLGTSYWFLFTSRSIGPQAMSVLLISALLLMFVRLKQQSHWQQIAASGFIAGLAVYMAPLTGWLSLGLSLVALIYTWQQHYDRLWQGWALYFVSFGFALIPLILAGIAQPDVVLGLFGLDTLPSLSELRHEGYSLGRSLVWDGSERPALLPRVGLLDWMTLTFVLFGILRSLATWRLHRSQILLLVGLVSILGVLLSSPSYVGLGSLLPISYLFAGRGLNQYKSEWHRRFPRNMSAKLIGQLVILTLVSFTVLYNLRAYYVAWARSEVVQSQFAPYSKEN